MDKILIVVDGLRYDRIGRHGYKNITPNIDKFIDKGISYSRYYATQIERIKNE
jgi:arylsulfatase A-like enzyme